MPVPNMTANLISYLSPTSTPCIRHPRHYSIIRADFLRQPLGFYDPTSELQSPTRPLSRPQCRISRNATSKHQTANPLITTQKKQSTQERYPADRSITPALVKYLKTVTKKLVALVIPRTPPLNGLCVSPTGCNLTLQVFVLE